MELWDIYDDNRELTGGTHERGKPMMEGDYHIVIHVWILNDSGQYLIQKRQPWKEGWSGMWDGSVAGSAVCGDSSRDAAIRETKEELGIDLDLRSSEILFTIKAPGRFDDIWFVRQNVNIKDLKLQYEEVADAKWASEKEIKEMVHNGEFIAYNYLDKIFEIINSKIGFRKAIMENS